MNRIVFVMSDMGMGGAQRVVSLLAGAMAQGSTEVHVVSLGSAGSFFGLPGAVKIRALGVTGQSPNVLASLAVNIRRIAVLRAALRQIRPACAISFQTETNCVTLLALLGTGLPVIISERSDPFVHPRGIWRVIRRLVYPLAHGAVLQTRQAQSFFRGVLRDSVVIFNPVSAAPPCPVNTPAAPFIVGVGRLSHEKGFDLLLAAHALARKDCPDLRLVLVGDGPERVALERQAEELGTASYIDFTGAQENPAGFYDRALAFVLPSRFEGLPNALLEAMARGCPPVSTPLFRAAPEIITHGQDGLIAADGGPVAMANQIMALYKDPALRTRLAAGARQSAARFEPAGIARAWMDYVSSIGVR